MKGTSAMVVRKTQSSLAAAAALATAITNSGCKGRPTHKWPAVPWAHLRAYAGAQNMYRRTDYDGDGVFEYAFPYTLLNTQLDSQGKPVRLIGDAFANASRDTPPSGATSDLGDYYYVDLVGDATKGAYYDGKGNFVRGHGLCAYPARYDRTGRYTLVIDIRGKVYAKDTGGKPVVVFPDVEREGWERLGG